MYVSGAKVDPRTLLTVNDMPALRALKRPEVIDLLNLAYTPRLTELALAASLAATQIPQDQGALVLLRDLNTKGHALARALAANPQREDFIDSQIRSRANSLNAIAARAVHGDKAAAEQLSALAAQAREGSAGESAFAATQALVAAQHYIRLRDQTSDYDNAFFILRRLSFSEAVAQAKFGAGIDRMLGTFSPPNVLLNDGRPLNEPGLQSDGRLAVCYGIDRPEWTPRELDAYDAACIPGSKAEVAARPWEVKFCADAAAVRVMAMLVNQGSTDSAVLSVLAQMKAMGDKSATERKLITAEATRNFVARDKPFECIVAFEPEERNDGSPPAPGLALVARKAASFAVFRIDPANGPLRKFTLIELMKQEPAGRYTAMAKVEP